MARKVFRNGLFYPFFALILGISSTSAVTTSTWEVQTRGGFEAGRSENVAITSEGKVTLSPAPNLVSKTDQLYIWSLVKDSRGNIYAGSGNEGKIFKVAKGEETSLFFDSPELEILSLAIDDEGNIYAGTAPDGIVYKIKPDGTPATFFNSEEKYVWSLAFDREGNLYAGTGDKGKIYKISRNGQGTLLFGSNETHIMSLVSDGEGNLYAGSEGNGIIYKLTTTGKVMVLYDTPQQEVHCLALDADHNLYAGATGGAGEGKAGVSPVETITTLTQGAKPEREESIIYKLTPEGVVSNLWVSPQPLTFSMLVGEDGNLTVGTGNEGMVYVLTPEGEATTLLKADGSQVLALCEGDGGDIFLGTGNMGNIYRLTSDYAKAGTLLSPVHDATIASKWGKICWEGETPRGTATVFTTRTGNTERPDETWSDWSGEYSHPSGEYITSPPARFIQWRARLSTSKGSITPVLRKVSVAYLQMNLRPEITSVTVYPPGKGITKARAKGRSEARLQGPEEKKEGLQVRPRKLVPLKRGMRTVKWEAEDPNGDSLLYSLYFRGTDEKSWKLLKEDLQVNYHTWDTEAFPDGTYLIKVVAIDSPGNPAGEALSDEKPSQPFGVDNTPPRVEGLKAELSSHGKLAITGKAMDGMSPIKKAEYSIDAGRWTVIFPVDGIFDSKEEGFSFTTEPLSPGEHTVVVKLIDAAGNVGAGKTVVNVGD